MKRYFQKIKAKLYRYRCLFREYRRDILFVIVVSLSSFFSLVSPGAGAFDISSYDDLFDILQSLDFESFLAFCIVVLDFLTILFIYIARRFPKQEEPWETDNIFFKSVYRFWKFCYMHDIEIVLVVNILFFFIWFLLILILF